MFFNSVRSHSIKERAHTLGSFLFVALMLLASNAMSQITEPDSRATVPPADAQQASLGAIKEIFADTYAKANKPEGKLELGRTLVKHANEIKGDAVARYVLLTESLRFSAEGSDTETALECIDSLASDYQVDEFELLCDSLDELGKTVKTATLARSIHEAARAGIDKALESDKYSHANRLCLIGSSVARKGKDASEAKQFVELKTSVAERQKEFEAVGRAKSLLEQDADDPKANFALGVHLIQRKRQWEEGLQHLSKCDDAELKFLARTDLMNPESTKARIGLADGWYAWTMASKKTKPIWGKALAAHWYGKVLDDVSGVEKIKVEKRLKELGELALSRDGNGVAASTIGAKPKGGSPSPTNATKTGQKSGKPGAANINDQAKRSLAVAEWARTTRNISVIYRFSRGTKAINFGDALPTEPFVVTSVNVANIPDADLKVLEGLSTLETLIHGNGNTTGEFLKFLAASTELRELHIHNAGTISEEYASDLKKFQRLQTVYLNPNMPVEPKVFRAVTSLPVLRLFSAKIGPNIDAADVETLARTKVSELFWFGSNGEQVAALRNVTGLTKLELVFTTATDADLAKLHSHKQLTNLTLTQPSHVSGSVFETWQRCPLTALTLYDCSLTPASLTAVSKLPLLTNLRLLRVRLPDDDASTLTNARNLTSFECFGTKVADWGFLKSLRLLKSVSLSDATISKDTLRELASRPLESISFRSMDITDEDLRLFLGHRTLTYVYLYRTKVTPGAVDELKQSNPKIGVSYIAN